MGVIGNVVMQDDRQVVEAVRRLIDLVADKPPSVVESAERRDDRRRFLAETLGSDGDVVFERIIAGDELQPVAYLERGAIAARAVAKIALRSQAGSAIGSGTGFLIAPGVLITNNHVIPDRSLTINSMAQFGYELDVMGKALGPVEFALDAERLFHTDVALDFTVVAVRPLAQDGTSRLDAYGYLPLLGTTGKAMEGEWLSLIQHPNGERKQVCVRENKLIKRQPDVLWYSSDTKPGSSGSPVFNNDWFVVALHHKGVPEMRDGVIQTVDGRDFDARTMSEDRVKWIGNEGVRASRIFATLQAALPGHPLLQPLFQATPASARVETPALGPDTRRAAPPTASAPSSPPALPATSPASTVMATNETITIPIEIRLTVRPDGAVAAPAVVASTESFAIEAKRSAEPKREAPFDPDYGKRKGYDPKFLGGGAKIVGLPVLGAQNEVNAAPLLSPTASNKHVLHYDNYSVVMHKDRRLAMFSAANVSFGHRYEMARTRDVWRLDPRIRKEHQLDGFYYANNQFDRGHLTRREDLEWGTTPRKALMSAGDTCHWTNCTPQHSRFNQNREIWQGIERYILEESIEAGHVDTQIITGPVLDEGDPEYKKIKYPLQFWKVVAALKQDGSLFATAYIASQAEVIAQYGIETTEAPFGAYKTFQTRIAEIERLTGLTFVSGEGGATPLSTYDPLEGRPVSRRRRLATSESTSGVSLPPDYLPIDDLSDIIV
ncbi:DNA/RNA non-specific endonuclease [Phreatobacter oligotrophus]|uniref:DNA/RNA non-specific endonuclease n=1 Tax=Phreatobacter oligotrophus TaxID=1122261 RepID=UPI0023553464|nr:DNA/RNA non-specific endonuclease [Phreatobacter oligotrophus]